MRHIWEILNNSDSPIRLPKPAKLDFSNSLTNNRLTPFSKTNFASILRALLKRALIQYFPWALALLFLSPCLLCANEPLLIVNSLTTSSTLPSRFRIAASLKQQEEESYISSEGLDVLKTSASSQFSIEELRAIKIELAVDKLIIVDLRKEPHGYINNYAVSWYTPKNLVNANLSLSEALQDEKERLGNVKTQTQLNLHKILEKGAGSDYATMLQLPTAVHYVCSEEELCHDMNLGYFRIAVTDHLRPTDEMVDRFIILIQTIPENTHLHFHCSAGAGRATTFMSMYDMIKNANTVSFEEIIERQSRLGGTHLLQPPAPTSWKYRHHFERQAFLKRFYVYARENEDDFTTSFSEWNHRTSNYLGEIEV